MECIGGLRWKMIWVTLCLGLNTMFYNVRSSRIIIILTDPWLGFNSVPIFLLKKCIPLKSSEVFFTHWQEMNAVFNWYKTLVYSYRVDILLDANINAHLEKLMYLHYWNHLFSLSIQCLCSLSLALFQSELNKIQNIAEITRIIVYSPSPLTRCLFALLRSASSCEILLRSK